jgi:hypothetical protein
LTTERELEKREDVELREMVTLNYFHHMISSALEGFSTIVLIEDFYIVSALK